MTYYNLHIENYNDNLTALKVPEDELQRVINAYDIGNDDVYINGERYILKGLKSIKIFSFNAPWDTLSQYLNSAGARQFHEFSRDGHIGLSIAGLASIGTDLTRNFIKDGFGWKKEKVQAIDVIGDFESDITKIKVLLSRFHEVATQLLQRRNEAGQPRSTLEIKDEYDVQDLLHSLLKIYFSDIRREEWNPSYAGSSKRSDFLLKKEKIIIEVKKTRTNLRDSEIGDQLIIDIAHYRNHKDCKTLICFVYDPEKKLTNPRGLENDLQSMNETFTVIPIVHP